MAKVEGVGCSLVRGASLWTARRTAADIRTGDGCARAECSFGGIDKEIDRSCPRALTRRRTLSAVEAGTDMSSTVVLVKRAEAGVTEQVDPATEHDISALIAPPMTCTFASKDCLTPETSAVRPGRLLRDNERTMSIAVPLKDTVVGAVKRSCWTVSVPDAGPAEAGTNLR